MRVCVISFGCGAHIPQLEYPRHGRHHKRGLFSYLGGIQHSQYINPSDSGVVLITASSISEGNLSEFIARVPSPHTLLCTAKEPFSWIAVDLGPNYVFCPSDYSLRFGGERQGICYAVCFLVSSVLFAYNCPGS